MRAGAGRRGIWTRHQVAAGPRKSAHANATHRSAGVRVAVRYSRAWNSQVPTSTASRPSVPFERVRFGEAAICVADMNAARRLCCLHCLSCCGRHLCCLLGCDSCLLQLLLEVPHIHEYLIRHAVSLRFRECWTVRHGMIGHHEIGGTGAVVS